MLADRPGVPAAASWNHKRTTPFPMVNPMVNVVTIHKASSHGFSAPPDLMIEAKEEFPDFTREEYFAGKSAELHKTDAEALGRAIIGTLPGGTIDRLLVFLLEHQVSLLRVKHRQ